MLVGKMRYLCQKICGEQPPVGARLCERPSIGLRKAVFYSVKGRLLQRERPSFGTQKAANRKLPDVQALTRMALRLACTHAIAA